MNLSCPHRSPRVVVLEQPPQPYSSIDSSSTLSLIPRPPFFLILLIFLWILQGLLLCPVLDIEHHELSFWVLTRYPSSTPSYNLLTRLLLSNSSSPSSSLHFRDSWVSIRLKPIIRFGFTSSRLEDGVSGVFPQHRGERSFPSAGGDRSWSGNVVIIE